MDKILLYYPTIEFPNEDWLRQSLLYSDKVASILPFSDESKYPDSIKYLNWKGEYSPIFIEDLISDNSTEYEFITKRFLNDIDNNKQIFHASSRNIRPNTVNSLFQNKFSKKIISELNNRNLIDYRRDDQIHMPENIAIYYMSILAQFVSNIIEDNIIIPSTDYTRFSKFSFENGMKSEQAINLIFKDCLPVPSKEVTISDIIEFKKNHSKDFKNFRIFYSATQETLKTCRDSMDVKEAIQLLKDKIFVELYELEKMYSMNKIQIIYSSLTSLFSLEDPKLFTSLLAAGVISEKIDSRVGLGIGAVLVGGKMVSNITRKPYKKKELNYLFEAKRKGIVR